MDWPNEYRHIFEILEDCGLAWRGGYWAFRCPAHDDRHASATARLGHKGLLLKCYAGAGCTYREILGALSEMAGRPINGLPNNGTEQGRYLYRTRMQEARLEGTWFYTDEMRNVLFRVLKFRHADGTKSFKQHARDESCPDGWRKNIDGTRRVLYSLPALLANSELPPGRRRVVWVCEGEKKADMMSQLGFLATTSSGGAGKFHLTESAVLDGCRVVVVPDVDPVNPRTGRRPGWDHALAVCSCLHGRAADLRVLVPPMPEGCGVDDWIDDGADEDKAAALKAMYHRAGHYDPFLCGAPTPPFVVRMGAELCKLRLAAPPKYHSRAEALGGLDVAVHAIRAHLAAERLAGRKVADDALGGLLATLAAECQRACEDLRLIGAPAGAAFPAPGNGAGNGNGRGDRAVPAGTGGAAGRA